MFQRALMIAGLRRQHRLLGELVQKLEGDPIPGKQVVDFYLSRTELVERNMSELREKEKDYRQHLADGFKD